MQKGILFTSGLAGLLTGAFMTASQTTAMAQLPTLPQPPTLPECVRNLRFEGVKVLPREELKHEFDKDYFSIVLQLEPRPASPLYTKDIKDLSFAHFRTECAEGHDYEYILMSRHELSEALNAPDAESGEDIIELRKANAVLPDHMCTEDEVKWVKQKQSKYPTSTAYCPSAF